MSKYKYRFYAEMNGGPHGANASAEVDLVDDLGENEVDLDHMDSTSLEKTVIKHWEEWFWNHVNGGFERTED